MRALRSVILSLACLCFGAALVMPVFSVTPGIGDLTGWIRVIRPENMATTQQTLIGSIECLWGGGDRVLASVVVLFCLLFPFFKFGVLWAEIYGADIVGTFCGRLAKSTASYAMVEVFVVAILVVAIKGLPGGTRIEVESGAWLLGGSVVVSLIAARLGHGSQGRFDTGKESRR
jgi:paraquat-inducible protein A